jgi:hypothetical protein
LISKRHGLEVSVYQGTSVYREKNISSGIRTSCK